MNYLMVNTADWDTFGAQYLVLVNEGYVFHAGYMEHVYKEDGTPFPGGVGCLKFDATVPSEILFPAPNVEFRYSEETNEWVSNGPTEMDQSVLAGLYIYFQELLGAA